MFDEPVPDLPGVPGELMGLLRAAMAYEPADRPTAVELRDALYVLALDPGDAPVRAGRRPVFVPPTPLSSPGPVADLSGDDESTRRYPFQVDPLRFTFGSLGTPGAAAGTPGPDGRTVDRLDGASEDRPVAAPGGSAEAGGLPDPAARAGVRGRPAGRHWLWMGLTVAVLLLVTAVGGYLGSGAGSPAHPKPQRHVTATLPR